MLWPQMFFGAEPAVARPAVLHVDLAKAIQMALARNFSIEVQRFDPKIAEQRVVQQLGRFDPNLTLAGSRDENTTRSIFSQAQRFPAADIIRQDRVSFGLTGLTPLGTEYDLGFSAVNSTGSLNRFEGNYTNTLSLGLRQPLLRNFGTDTNLAQIRIARNNVLISDWGLRRQIIDTITETITIYNNLHLAHESLRVARGFQELARQVYNDNEARVRIGVMSPLDVTTARAEVARREEAVIVAQRAVFDNENFLKQIITNDLQRMLDIRVEIDPPPTPTFYASVAQGIDDALQLRPDYRQNLIDIQNQHILVAFTKNQALPRLDLQTSLDLLGFDNDIGTATSRIGHSDRTAWSIGTIFSVPIPNREGKGAVVAAKLTAAQALVNLHRLEQQIVVDVDNAIGQIVTTRQRIESTQEASKLAVESLNAGEERLKAGTGTTFEVLELQRNLADAELAELRARADYNKAVSEYHRQTGTTLLMHGVKTE